MKFTLYLAVSSVNEAELVYKYGGRAALISWPRLPSWNKPESWPKLRERLSILKEKYPDRELLLDSGGFQIRSGKMTEKELDVKMYAEFLRVFGPYFSHFITLDVPGRPDATLRNYRFLCQAGLRKRPLWVDHVWKRVHPRVLKGIYRQERKVCLSVPRKSQFRKPDEKPTEWKESVHELCKETQTGVHLLASGSPREWVLPFVKSADVMVARGKFGAAVEFFRKGKRFGVRYLTYVSQNFHKYPKYLQFARSRGLDPRVSTAANLYSLRSFIKLEQAFNENPDGFMLEKSEDEEIFWYRR